MHYIFNQKCLFHLYQYRLLSLNARIHDNMLYLSSVLGHYSAGDDQVSIYM